jgi:hypothetical protein
VKKLKLARAQSATSRRNFENRLRKNSLAMSNRTSTPRKIPVRVSVALRE